MTDLRGFLVLNGGRRASGILKKAPVGHTKSSPEQPWLLHLSRGLLHLGLDGDTSGGLAAMFLNSLNLEKSYTFLLSKRLCVISARANTKLFCAC